MIKLYADPITVNCRKVLAGFDLIGAPFELNHVDYFTGKHKEAEYLALNPNASVPTLADGDFVLWESNAMLQYMADKQGNESAYPRDPQVRADINRWMFWESAGWFPTCYSFLVENCVKPLLGGSADPAIVEAQTVQFHKLAEILDARLAKHRWVAGTPSATIADIALAAPMHLHGWQQLPFAQHVNIKRWLTQDVEQLPSWKKTWVGEGFKTQQA